MTLDTLGAMAQTPMFNELPMDNPEAAKKKQRVRNCLQDMLLEIMDERKCSLADIQKHTKIPWGTLYGWFKGDVTAQYLDHNIAVLAKYFQVSIEYLAFGYGDSGEFEKEKPEPKKITPSKRILK